MSRRRLLLLATAITLIVAVAGAWLFWAPSMPRVTQPNADRIQVGMTVERVEALLGPRTERPWCVLLPSRNSVQRWAGGDLQVFIEFDPQWRVVKTPVCSPTPAPKTLTEKVRRWLRL